MSEGKVNWKYTCPTCKDIFSYSMFAGEPVRICDKCQTVEMVKSTGGGYY